MFTGIVQHIGRLQDKRVIPEGLSLYIDFSKKKDVLNTIDVGDSVCLNGICLTVSQKRNQILMFNAVHETIKNTTIKYWQRNDLLNIELALLPTTRLGGHLVTGHIDGMGEVISIEKFHKNWNVSIQVDNSIIDEIVPRGSVCIDGISLTVVDTFQNTFKVTIIPHTLENTNFKWRKLHHKVNIETDILVKYIKSFLFKSQNFHKNKKNTQFQLFEMLKKFEYI